MVSTHKAPAMRNFYVSLVLALNKPLNNVHVTSLLRSCRTQTIIPDNLLLQLRYDERHDVVSNHRQLDSLFNRLFRLTSNETPKRTLPARCDGKPQVTSGFPSQRVSNAGNVWKSWCHHAKLKLGTGVPASKAWITRLVIVLIKFLCFWYLW